MNRIDPNTKLDVYKEVRKYEERISEESLLSSSQAKEIETNKKHKVLWGEG